ncbi:MAG: cation:proton antiporter [Fibrobacterota bacterium]|nr:cation:proton antiporter [Fibrobacterota bacterium]
MNTALAIAFTGALIFLAHLFVALFRKTRIPDALLLIGIGILLGPILKWVGPEHLGKVGPVFSMLALAVILFEGGHETRLQVLKKNWRAALGLILPAFIVTMVSSAILLHYIFDLGPNRALLLGAILGSTSPSVVVAMARHLDMRSGPRLVLTLETAVSDVLCVVLVLGFIAAAKDGALRIPEMIADLAVTFGISAVLGTLAGLIWSFLLTHLRTIRHNILLSLALVLVLFGTLEIFHLSGGIAVLCFGAAITNSAGLNIPRYSLGRFGQASSFTDREKAFFGEAVFLLKTFFFVYLGLSLHLTDARLMLLAAGLVMLKILIRIPFVRLAMPRSETKRDASLMSVMASMGLASAVLASLPLQEGLEGGELIRDLTYAIILASIVANSVFVFLIDRTPFGTHYGALFTGFRKETESGEFPTAGVRKRPEEPLDPGT